MGSQLTPATKRLIEAAKEVLKDDVQPQCQCSVAERLSGHVSGCWFPDHYEVLMNLATATRALEAETQTTGEEKWREHIDPTNIAARMGFEFPDPDDAECEFEWHGCFTGDCPHESAQDCARHFFKAGQNSSRPAPADCPVHKECTAIHDELLKLKFARSLPAKEEVKRGDGSLADQLDEAVEAMKHWKQKYWETRSKLTEAQLNIMKLAAESSAHKPQADAGVKEIVALLRDSLRSRRFSVPEDPEVMALGRRIGFGALLDSAQKCWREVLEEQGLSGGEFTVGHCRATVEKALKAYDAREGK